MTVELAYKMEGSGSPFVCLLGLLGAGRNWMSVARTLAERFTFILPDLRNHGSSPWAEPIDYPSMVDDVTALLDRLGCGPVTLLGHSMGGKAAMHLALRHPERVDRLVIVDIAPVSYPPGLEDTLAALTSLDLEHIRRRADADEALKPVIPSQSERAFLLQNLEFRDGRFVWRANVHALERALPTLRAFAPPAGAVYPGVTGVIRGARSDYVRDEDEPAIRSLFPAASIHVVEDSGHWPHVEQPAAFLDVLEACLVR
jgi:pimeloyl-ACP methyl ester carboxylesterase